MSIDPKVLIPILRKTIATIIAQEIVGVQPMSLPPKIATWQSDLKSLSERYNSWMTIQEKSGDGLADATELMQDKYPGPYRLVEYYDNDQGVRSLKLHFDDPKEETLWLLRWS